MADQVNRDIAARFANRATAGARLSRSSSAPASGCNICSLSVRPSSTRRRLPGDGYACTFVSENLRAIMGYSPEEMTTDPKCWPERLHRGRAARVIAELAPLIEQGGGTVAYRFRHRDGHYIWIQDTFKVIRNDGGQPARADRRLGRHHRTQGRAPAPAIPARCQPGDHLHDARFRRLSPAPSSARTCRRSWATRPRR